MRRRRGVALIVVVAAEAVLIGLGLWQLQRLDWKRALIAERDAAMSARPLALSNLPGPVPSGPDFRRVVLSGRYTGDRQLVRPNQGRDNRTGIDLMAPLTLDDGNTILVDRGFVPFDNQGRPASMPVPDGPVTVTGYLRRPQPPGPFTPANDRDANQWYWVDLAAMADALGQPLACTAYVERLRDPDDLAPPIGRDPPEPYANDHRNYALTWFFLAGILAVLYGASWLRRGERHDEHGLS